MPARHDDVDDPRLAATLQLARHGTAYFSRKLNELSDAELDGPSLLPGWSRRHVIAHVGYNARALTRLLEWAATGVETPMYPSPEQRRDEIDYGATLSPLALRHLVAHATVHLNVEWRDLPAKAWQAEVRTAQGRTVPAAETAWMRTREVWIHAVDLDNGGSFNAFPPELVDALTADVLASWQRRGTMPKVHLRPTDRAPADPPGPSTEAVLEGTAADLLRWATGRGGRRIISTNGSVPEPPNWL
jgi:maleylpyruvate isomerase